MSKYLSYYNDERKNITIRQILNMTSGLEFPENEHESMFFRYDQAKYAREIGLEKQPEQIFEKDKVNVFFKSSSPDRTELINLLKELKSSGFEKISLELTKKPLSARKAITSYAFLTDCLVKTTWEFATKIKFPTYNPTNAEKLSIVSVGGYGLSLIHISEPTRPY